MFVFDSVVGEFTKKPEELDSKQLGQATSLAVMLTKIRQLSYLIVSILLGLMLFNFILELTFGAPFGWLVQGFSGLFIFSWCLFKFRDFLRGTI